MSRVVGAARCPMVVYVALAYAISWVVWAGMIVFSIKPSFGPNCTLH